MNDIELLQYGLDEGLHKKEGWLWRRLVLEGVVEDSKESLRVRVFQAHQAQKIFIMAQKQVMPVGWDPIDPIRSVKVNKVTGQFQSLSKASVPVPANVLTQSFLMFAYGIPKETFRRWMGEGSEYRERIPHNKGKSVVDDSKWRLFISRQRSFSLNTKWVSST
jgi:hypothetical protein